MLVERNHCHRKPYVVCYLRLRSGTMCAFVMTSSSQVTVTGFERVRLTYCKDVSENDSITTRSVVVCTSIYERVAFLARKHLLLN